MNDGLEAAARTRGQADMAGKAAAGAADGALGLARPAASGSRWRRNAARQDFSRSARARRSSGIAAVTRARPAIAVSSAKTAAKAAPASTAPASTVSADGLTASCARSRSRPASTASRLPSAVIAVIASSRSSDPPREEDQFSAYALSGELGDRGEQAIDLGRVGGGDEAGPGRGARFRE